MTREEASFILANIDRRVCDDELNDAMDMAIKALEEPKTEWIPVSDRLPEKDGYYITSTIYKEVYCDYWNSNRFERTETVIAWMPLPEPYKESEDKE